VAVAEELAFTVPDADPLFIGDMSRKGGGWLRGHVTHDVGLDADIGLFSIDRHQPLSGFEDVPSWKLDTEATWLLIKAFLDTGRVDFILLDQSLIRKLRTYLLENAILPEDEVDRIFPPYATAKWWDLDGIVRHASGHRNHMHVRVRCE
jgi:penicillin-insensitive murein endopeptidase